MQAARLGCLADLPSMLALFAASEVSSIAEPWTLAEQIWQETLAHPGIHAFVSDGPGCVAAALSQA